MRWKAVIRTSAIGLAGLLALMLLAGDGFLFPAREVTASQNAEIAGYVTRGAVPQENWAVYLTQTSGSEVTCVASTFTDSSGFYRLTDLSAGILPGPSCGRHV